MIRALIFDMDGLMINTERMYFETEQEMAAEYGLQVSESTLWKIMGRKPLDAVTILVEETGIPEKPEDFLERREKIMLEKMRRGLQPLPGLFEILKEYKNKCKMAVATGARRNFLDLTLDKLDIREYFDVLQPSDEIVQGKPHPEIYFTACRKLELQPEQCAVLEDSSNGCRAGKDAGCYVVAVPSEYTRQQDFTFVDYIADDLLEASEHLKKLAEYE